MDQLQFNKNILTRRKTSGIDVETTLSHFAIITYMVEPELLRPHIHERFKLDCIINDSGEEKALISVVPFLDKDFRFVNLPWIKNSFGQINYRAYVTDTKTGENVAWFFGTSLDSLSVYIPKFVWKLPWHKSKITFDVDYNKKTDKYSLYKIKSISKWASLDIEIEDTGKAPESLLGFPDLETGLVLLTHPLKGYFYLNNGKLGHYSIWHDQLKTTVGNIVNSNISLFPKLGLDTKSKPITSHSVLIQANTDFTIYLPPVSIKE